MFKLLQIELTEPICQCNAQNLKWTFAVAPEIQLRITCSTCDSVLHVKQDVLKAYFVLDQPYPNQIVKVKK